MNISSLEDLNIRYGLLIYCLEYRS